VPRPFRLRASGRNKFHPSNCGYIITPPAYFRFLWLARPNFRTTVLNRAAGCSDAFCPGICHVSASWVSHFRAEENANQRCREVSCERHWLLLADARRGEWHQPAFVRSCNCGPKVDACHHHRLIHVTLIFLEVTMLRQLRSRLRTAVCEVKYRDANAKPMDVNERFGLARISMFHLDNLCSTFYKEGGIGREDKRYAVYIETSTRRSPPTQHRDRD
jgi:hypothetical protein